MSQTARRLQELGIDLPVIPEPLANYVPAKRSRSLVTTAGQVSSVRGEEFEGKIGEVYGVEEGQRATRACAINCLAALLTVVDSLDSIAILAVHGLVNSTADFTGHAAVMNGASDLFVDVLGEKGKHTRTAVGVAGLPLDYTASVYVVAEVTD